MEQERFAGATLAELKQSWPFAHKAEEIAGRRVIEPPKGLMQIVLDDDPTGTQTVHDIPVLTTWDRPALRAEFERGSHAFYILTNSRAMNRAQTEATHREIAQNVFAEAARAKREYLLLSRSDSTLRGHYPLETQTLRETLEGLGHKAFDGEIICPFFLEGNRFTCENVHYLVENNVLLPVGQSEFAKDSTFGYTFSSLPAYVEEKTEGAVKANQVVTIPLALLRNGDVEGVAEILNSLQGYRRIVVNAIDYGDLMVFVTALWTTVAAGKQWMFRTAASLVRVMIGCEPKPLLTGADICDANNGAGGLIIVGSHTAKTTQQLGGLVNTCNVNTIAFHTGLVSQPDLFEDEIRRVTALADQSIAEGKDTVILTKRTLQRPKDGDAEAALKLSTDISQGLTRIVAGLESRPRFVIAKGGITSSDVATCGLGIKRAMVLGQILPGIPVWHAGAESRFPGMNYIIFPGNVGEAGTLAEIVTIANQR